LIFWLWALAAAVAQMLALAAAVVALFTVHSM
jgi:hypothetical protein